jgi:hypothetical protein
VKELQLRGFWGLGPWVDLLLWLMVATLRDTKVLEKLKKDLPGLQGFSIEGLSVEESSEFGPGTSLDARSNDAATNNTVSERIFPPLSGPLHP